MMSLKKGVSHRDSPHQSSQHLQSDSRWSFPTYGTRLSRKDRSSTSREKQPSSFPKQSFPLEGQKLSHDSNRYTFQPFHQAFDCLQNFKNKEDVRYRGIADLFETPSERKKIIVYCMKGHRAATQA